MSEDFFESLVSKDERRELKCCGITSVELLAKITPAALRRELDQARSFFPLDINDGTFSNARLEYLYREACAHLGIEPQEGEQEAPAAFLHAAPAPKKAEPEVTMVDDFIVRRQPTESQFFNDLPQMAISNSGLGQAQEEKGKSKRFSTIRCGHSTLVFFGALVTLLLIPCIAMAIYLPVAILGNGISMDEILLYMGIMAAVLIIYFIYNYHAKCTVCHIHLFSFRNYPRNKYAHYLPLLGYTFTLALRIVFTGKFTCPACGTKLRLGHREHYHEEYVEEIVEEELDENN